MNDTHDNPMTPIDEQLWQCPECGHEMTERESQLYRGCPTGMHFVQHRKVTRDQPMPKPLGEWTAFCAGLWGIETPDHVICPAVLSKEVAKSIADAHNAALAALREQLAAAYEKGKQDGFVQGRSRRKYNEK